MKTIKFRGYNLKNKKWLYGYYFVNRGKSYIVQDEVVNPFVEESDFEVDPESVGQYICDINNVECYEGDVIEKSLISTLDNYGSFTFVIKYNSRATSYGFKNVFNEWVGVYPEERIFNYRILGNEYEQKISNL